MITFYEDGVRLSYHLSYSRS